MTDEAPIVLDACVCLNLAAALDGDLAGLLGWIPYVVPQVVAEALFLHDRVDGQLVAAPVSLQGLAVTSLTEEETTKYVDFARRPEAARRLLGDDAWELLRPDRPEPADHNDPGIPMRRLRAVIATLERL